MWSGGRSRPRTMACTPCRVFGLRHAAVIYDYCNMNNFDDTNEGSIYYDDNQGSCEDNEESAQLYVLLEAGVTYWVRFANMAGDCGGFDWTLEYSGPPRMPDETACNYNPAAEVDNGSCITRVTLCTGPDLMVVESAIETAFRLRR